MFLQNHSKPASTSFGEFSLTRSRNNSAKRECQNLISRWPNPLDSYSNFLQGCRMATSVNVFHALLLMVDRFMPFSKAITLSFCKSSTTDSEIIASMNVEGFK